MGRATIAVHLDDAIAEIRPELYGHFAEHLGACVDEGIWVGCDSTIPNIDGLRRDVIEALRRIRVPVMRWPGGCFADDYHWMDGIGPRERRPRTVNMWWGQTIETNHFGTHEFMRFCELIGARPYVAGNLGSGSVREMRDWVEYCNFAGDSALTRLRRANGADHPFNVKYWGVGNENWGCGGHFCPEDYAAEYKRYATYLRDFSGVELYLIACGPDSGRDAFHADWTRRFFQKLGSFNRIHGFAAHYYCGTAGQATSFTTDQWYELLERGARMRDVIETHRAIMDEFDPQRKIGLIVDEWGTWHLAPPPKQRDPRYLWQQQSTLRDALVAAITLNIFNTCADKLVMCNVAQTINVLQSLCLTSGERLVLTPTYHVYDMFQPHQGGLALRTTVESPHLSFTVGAERRSMAALGASASLKSGVLTLTVTNAHATLPQEVELALRGRDGARLHDLSVRVLSHEDLTAHNTFDEPDVLRPSDVSARFRGNVLQAPPACVCSISARIA